MHYRPLRRAGLLAATLCLLLPAGALAETLTVDPADTNDTCTRSGADKTCKTILAAVTAAQGGDTIKVLKGTYAESVNVTDRQALRIEGAGDVKITGTGSGDVVTIASDNVTLAGVSVEVPANAGSAVLVSGAGAVIENVALSRAVESNVNDAVVEVTGSATLNRALITQNAGAAGAEGAPAIRSTGAGTAVNDAIVISLKGPAAVFEAGEANRLVRSVLLAANPAANAVQVTSASGSTANKKLLADSSVIVPGAEAAGLQVVTSGNNAGDVTADLRHVTIALGVDAPKVKGIVLDATNAQGPGGLAPNPAGNISATVSSSIVHGASSANEYAPSFPANLTTAANSVSLKYSSSDAPAATGNGEIDMGGAQATPPAQLFVPGRLSLRPDAPVIDKGAAPAAEDSATDFEGDKRVIGAASDIGADEFSNKPPTAKFGVTNTNPRAGELVGFGSLSTDPEQAFGRGIREWRWDFGDGKRETTTVGGVAHTYETPGTYQATLTVVDQGGLTSTAGAQTIVVRDGTPVAIKLTSPKSRRVTVNRLPKKAKKGSKRKPKIPAARPLSVSGTATDPSGVKQVQVALRLLRRSRVPTALRPAFRKTTTGTTAQSRTCEHYIGSKGFEKRPCDKVSYFVARFKDGTWQFNTSRKLRLPPGTYDLLVRATDGSDLVSVPSSKDGTLVRFTIR